MVSLRARLMRLVIRLKTRGIDESMPIEQKRTGLDEMGQMTRMPAAVRIQSVQLNGLHAQWVSPAAAAEDRVLLYFHGGGYSRGSCRSHRGLVAQIANAAGTRALVPEYRLAPENVFPAAVEDAVNSYLWLIDNGVEADQIVLAGDSAGGGLALATALSLRSQGIALPAAIALISPWTDLAGVGETLNTRRRSDPWLKPEQLRAAALAYAGDAALDEPLISPLYADLAGMPRMLIQVGDCEILLSDSQRLAARAAKAGVPVELRVWPGMWHVWHAFAGQIQESDAAISEMARFVRAAFGESGVEKIAA